MTRKMLTATTLVFALLLSVMSIGAFTSSADAQCTYDEILAGCKADPIPYTGPFTNMPATAGGPYGWGSLNPAAGGADGGAGGAGGGAGGGLAHTGSSADVLGYVGAGMVAFGAVGNPHW